MDANEEKTESPEAAQVKNLFPNFNCAELTDVGMKRKNNEDSVVSIPEQGVFVVADGLGGAQAGEYASNEITVSVKTAFTDPQNLAKLKTFEDRCELLRQSLHAASRQIKTQSLMEGFHGTASTVVAVIFDPEKPYRAIMMHAGDSRAYLYRDGLFKQVTIDHSFMAAAGVKDPYKIPKRLRNMVTRVVGVQNEVPLDDTPVTVKTGDIILLCSDGLTNMVPDPIITKVIKQYASQKMTDLAKSLVETAIDHGGDDNITVNLIRIASSPQSQTLYAHDADDKENDPFKGQSGLLAKLLRPFEGIHPLLTGGIFLVLVLVITLLIQLFK